MRANCGTMIFKQPNCAKSSLHLKKGHPMPALIPAFAALLLASTATAVSATADTLFYCQTANGKQVHIQQHDSNVRYRFGKAELHSR